MKDFARMFDGPTVGKRESGGRALWLVPANGATSTFMTTHPFGFRSCPIG